MEGKRLRRHVLRGAVLVFVTSGYSGAGRALTLSRPPEWLRFLRPSQPLRRLLLKEISVCCMLPVWCPSLVMSPSPARNTPPAPCVLLLLRALRMLSVLPALSLAAGKRFIFEKAKELGVRSVVIDGPESWSQVRPQGGGPRGWSVS